MQYWLFKTEPDEYSLQDLANAPQQTDMWDGIRNYQARNFLRDKVAEGDRVLMYHSQCKNVGVVGIAEVVRAAYADPAQFNQESKYYDGKATLESPRWFCVDIRFVSQFNQVVSLKSIKAHPELQQMVLVKQGRLSVQPVTAQEWQLIEHLGR
ncbi:EVE domain-containing protein [Motilimonas pumila]|uniref:EVE domain-containing protein n=1 Tax=Motilimonas pumila TaxID=2303987 RepID=A0A418YGJ9_9GAMM|nr:EVE domain-containing protein [Motilimonas pumila]RJG48960.1 EVE domain-containing protein [Motilimonas pumila]